MGPYSSHYPILVSRRAPMREARAESGIKIEIKVSAPFPAATINSQYTHPLRVLDALIFFIVVAMNGRLIFEPTQAFRATTSPKDSYAASSAPSPRRDACKGYPSLFERRKYALFQPRR
jgi:hypothetical protein